MNLKENYNIVNKLKLIHSNWLENINDRFDIIISNPPYISNIEILANNVKLYDPKQALINGVDGLDSYREIAYNIDKICNKDSLLFFRNRISAR